MYFVIFLCILVFYGWTFHGACALLGPLTFHVMLKYTVLILTSESTILHLVNFQKQNADGLDWQFCYSEHLIKK